MVIIVSSYFPVDKKGALAGNN